MKKPLKLPTFESEDQERDYWADFELQEFFEERDFEPVSFPNLKPSTETISMRLPKSLLNDIKALANAQDVPYQSLMKMFLAERMAHELRDAGLDRYTQEIPQESDDSPNSSS